MQTNARHARFVPLPRGVNLLAAAAGALFLALYVLTLSPGVFPGAPAAWMAAGLGIEPFATPGHPLWRWTVALWRHLAPGAPVHSLNLLAALCGAATAALLGRYTMRWVHARLEVDVLNEQQVWRAALLAGAVAAATYATSVAGWVTATRLHPLSFDALLLLLAASLLQDYDHQGGRWRAYALALFCGIGATETTLFILAAPFLAAGLVVALYRRHEIPWQTALGLTATGVAGTGLYVASVWLFHAGTGMTGPACAAGVVEIWRSQLHEIARFLPRTGWVAVLLLVIVPWTIIQFSGWRGLNRAQDASGNLFHAVVTVAVLLAQFSMPLLPWSRSQPSGRLPVLEMALTAMMAGYVAAYWLTLFFSQRAPQAEEGRRRSAATSDIRRLSIGLAGFASAALLALLAVAAVRNARQADGRRGAFADTYAQALLDQLGERTWLVTDGQIDKHLAILAHARTQRLNLVDLTGDRDPVRGRRVRALIDHEPAFADHRMRLRNAASLGAAPFIQEWLAADTQAVSRLVLYGVPDLWTEAGLHPLPDRLAFAGVRDLAAIQPAQLLAEHRLFWDRIDKIVFRSPGPSDSVDALRHALRRHVALVANNLGVLLEDQGRPEDAYQAYAQALAFEPDSVSAALNRSTLIQKGLHPEDQRTAEYAAADALKTLKESASPGNLVQVYGHVRTPAAFAGQGAAWMRSGQPGMAAAAMQRAVALAADDNEKALFLRGLASLRASAGDKANSEEIQRELLAANPLDAGALLGMFNATLHRGDYAAAQDWLDKARQSGAPADVITLADATLDLANGQPASARNRLLALTDRAPGNLPAWALLATAMVREGRTAEAEQAILPKLQAAVGKGTHPLVFLTQATVAKGKGPSAYAAARTAYRNALRLEPGRRDILEEILTLDAALRDHAAVEIDARELLRLDRNHPGANYLLGGLLCERGEVEAAEAHMRRSVAAGATALSWNGLAEILRLRGALDEAEKAARQSLALNGKTAATWDTLACVLLDAARAPEARQAIAQARTIDKTDPRLALTEAQILTRLGAADEARALVRQLLARTAALPAQQQSELGVLARKLGVSSGK